MAATLACDNCRQHLRLTLQPRQPVDVVGELLGQHLDGDLAHQVGVLGQVHLAHAALAERFEDLVMTKGLANHDDGLLSGEEPAAL